MGKMMKIILSHPILYQGYIWNWRRGQKCPSGTDIAIELTNRCNSKCSFCVHAEQLTRKRGDMDIETLQKTIEWIQKFDKLNKVRSLTPVGLGEPLLYPHLDEALDMMREMMVGTPINMNTNGFLLEERGYSLIDRVDILTISLCFAEAKEHQMYMEVDQYDKVISGIEKFFKLKGDKLPSTSVHIFFVRQNWPYMKKHVKRWLPLLNANDQLRYVGLMDNRHHYKTGAKSQCIQPRCQLSITRDGRIYPCCMGPWRYPADKLQLGTISDTPGDILVALKAFQETLDDGDLSRCEGCNQIEQIYIKDMQSLDGKEG